MARPIINVTESAALYTVTVQPGEVVQDLALNVYDLLKSGETVSSAQADDTDTVTAAAGAGRLVVIDISGPGNGVQAPVKLTVLGSLGSIRHVSLNIIGSDPFASLNPTTPNLYLRWRGGYSPVTVYAPFDLVLYGGIIYMSLAGNQGSTPDISITDWMAWAGTGEGGGGSSLIPDAGGSGRYAAFRMTWVGPGNDDWQVEVVGVQ